MTPIVPPPQVEELLEPFGGVEASLESLRRFEANRAYISANRERLMAQHPDEWVCVLDERVAAHGRDGDAVARVVREAHEDTRGMALEYLDTEPRIWLL